MEQEKNTLKSNKHIIIMSILSIFFSLLTGAPNILLLLVMGVLPLVCSILFLITKHPVFGIICTVCFFGNRVGTFTGKGTLLSTVLILLITAYFVYVDYLSMKDWKIRKEIKDKK